MKKIAICDDQINFQYFLKTQIINYCKSNLQIVDIDIYSNGTELIERYSDKNYDIIFMDIDMPEIDGITTAQKIREVDQQVLLIFCTAFANRVYEVFTCNPFDFIRKTNIHQELNVKLSRIFHHVDNSKTEYIFETRDDIMKVSLHEIIYFQIVGRYVEINTTNGKYQLMDRNLQEVKKVFLKKGFVEFYRGCIVNLNFILKITKNTATLDNGEELPISRYKMVKVKKYFLKNGR